MATFGELQDRVEVALIDLPSAVVAAVPRLVNEAIRKAQDQHNFQVMKTTLSATTTLQTRLLVAVPSDFKEYAGNPYLTMFAGPILRMDVAPSAGAAAVRFPGDEEGTPRFIVRTDLADAGTSNFHVYPLSDGASDYVDGEYRITLPYWRILPALSADGDTNWFTANAERWITMMATADGFALDWDEGREAAWLKKAQIEWQQMLTRDKLATLSQMQALVPHQGAREMFFPT